MQLHKVVVAAKTKAKKQLFQQRPCYKNSMLLTKLHAIKTNFHQGLQNNNKKKKYNNYLSLAPDCWVCVGGALILVLGILYTCTIINWLVLSLIGHIAGP